MFRQLLAALLLVALANAGQSDSESDESPETDESTNHVEMLLERALLFESIHVGNFTVYKDIETIETLFKTVYEATWVNAPSSASLQAFFQTLANELRTLTLPQLIVINHHSSYGIFPTSGNSVYIGTKWESWKVGIPKGGHLAVDQPIESVAPLDNVVGVVVEGVTAERTVLLATRWKLENIGTNETHFEQSRTVNVFLYEATGDEVDVQVFWEPHSADCKRVRCEAWPGPGKDGVGIRCETATFGAGLVGCRCPRATFVEGGLRRASVLVVEESETEANKATGKFFERVLRDLRNFSELTDGIKYVIDVILALQLGYPKLFFKPNERTSAMLVDIGTVVHIVNETLHGGFALSVGNKLSLAVVEGEGGSPLAGLYFGKWWSSDDPEHSVYHGSWLTPEESLLGESSGTEEFAVKIIGNGSLPRRGSVVLSDCDRNFVERKLLEKTCSTKRVADVVFSGEGDKVQGDGVEVGFEYTTMDWTAIHCLAWDFNSSVWDDNACTSQNVSIRHHSCRCPTALFKIDNRLRARIQIIEETPNKISFADWDNFNRTLHHFGQLAKLTPPKEELSNINRVLETYVLRYLDANKLDLPPRLIDDLASIQHRLELDSHNSTAFDWRNVRRKGFLYFNNESSSAYEERDPNVAMFVQDKVNGPLATVAITSDNGSVWNASENDSPDFAVAVDFKPPLHDVGRVALTYLRTSRSKSSDSESRIVDVSWSQTTPSSGSYDVVLRLKPFVVTKQAVTVLSKTCRYWDFDRQDWSEGCKIYLHNDKELCQCTIPKTNDGAIGHARFHIASEWTEQ